MLLTSWILECSVTGTRHEQLQYLISGTTTTSPPSSSSTFPQRQDFDVVVLDIFPRYAWYRPGTFSAITFHTPGLGDLNFSTVKEEENKKMVSSRGGFVEKKQQQQNSQRRLATNHKQRTIPIRCWL
jgi:hypothetical protein